MAAVSGPFVFVVLLAPIALYALTAAEADDTDTSTGRKRCGGRDADGGPRTDADRGPRGDENDRGGRADDADGRWDDRDDDRRNGRD